MSIKKISLTVLFFCIFIFPSNSIFAQYEKTILPLPLNEIKEDWERIYIDGLGSFDLPPTMELQKGPYKEITSTYRTLMGVPDDYQLIAQQKGLNKFGEEGFKRYARLMIRTEIGRSGDYEGLYWDISDLSREDILELNNLAKNGIQADFLNTGLKLIEWYPLRVEKVNGMSCIHVAYKRQMNQNEPVLVNMYYFQNNDRMHNITLSYRLSEESYWKSDFDTILKSIRINTR
jgi:hypothetical protein